MKRKMVWLVVSYLMVLALLAASCAKAEAPATKEAAPVVKEAAPAGKEVTPAGKETTPAATEAPKYGGTLITARNSNIINWDEAYMSPWAVSNNLALVNEDLLFADWAQGAAGTGEFTYGGSGYFVYPRATVGLLAESWELPDDETIIFHLRKGVHWALDPNNAASKLVGGREFTADDVVFNENRIYLDSKSTMYSVAGVTRPVNISATDKYTVVVKAPKGLHGMTWEYTGYNVRIMAPEVAKKYGDYQQWENSVGTGPFILKDYVAMSSATWVRNPNYYGTDPVGPGKGNQLPYVDSVKIFIIPDSSTRMAALRTGKIDQDTFAYPAMDAQSLLKTSPQLKYFRELGGYPIIGIRLDKPGLPWAPQDDPNALKVRRALNMAMNNQEICDTIYGGEGEILSYKIVKAKLYESIYTPLEQLPQDSRELFEYHPDKAKQLLTEAGYPNGFKALVLVNSSSPVQIDTSQMIKNYWAKVGVDLEIQVMTSAVMNGLQLTHKHEQMYYYGRSSYNPHVMYSSVTDNMYNMSIVSDPILDDYYLKMGKLYLDRAKRDPVMKEMNLYAISRSHYITPPVSYNYYFWQPWLKNYHGEVSVGSFQAGAHWKFVWLDQELKKSMGR